LKNITAAIAAILLLLLTSAVTAQPIDAGDVTIKFKSSKKQVLARPCMNRLFSEAFDYQIDVKRVGAAGAISSEERGTFRANRVACAQTSSNLSFSSSDAVYILFTLYDREQRLVYQKSFTYPEKRSGQ
jgi:hypothetical protein